MHEDTRNGTVFFLERELLGGEDADERIILQCTFGK
jgi:hypothetical protein